MTRTNRIAVAAAAAGAGIALAGVGTAAAAPSSSASQEAARTVNATFDLLVANESVTFTVDGDVVASGVTDETGKVSVSVSTDGFAPGHYRLVATAESGVSSSVAFAVQ